MLMLQVVEIVDDIEGDVGELLPWSEAYALWDACQKTLLEVAGEPLSKRRFAVRTVGEIEARQTALEVANALPSRPREKGGKDDDG